MDIYVGVEDTWKECSVSTGISLTTTSDSKANTKSQAQPQPDKPSSNSIPKESTSNKPSSSLTKSK